ncbi:hypothetical protein B0F90DRAFT_1673571 [Multifurca ochricompacta]|uniref:Uncharacterized protein n=1 Tax=Multifurca ochricompacta TaxID=376703 RepID=A0AAD4QTA7_9AGAM|nr:hypothetical protein B0F90DRAFT_1673571 [Multifurca ochricompacta]
MKFIALVSIALAASTFALPLRRAPENGLVLDARAHPGGSKSISRSFLSEIVAGFKGPLTNGPQINSGSSNHAPLGILPASNVPKLPIKFKFGGKLRRALRDVSRHESD